MASDTVDRLEEVLDRLYSARGDGPGLWVQLPYKDVWFVVSNARQALLQKPALLEVDPPINICGDLHGQFWDLLRIFEFIGRPPNSRYLFLGDYVDRGPQSLEVIVLLLALRIKYPEHIILLRGNHECRLLNKYYGFYKELDDRGYTGMENLFADCFNCLPVAAVVGGRIFCCHGGLSPELKTVDQIKNIKRPVDVPRSGLLCDLLWSDPEYGVQEWVPNQSRGCAYRFGPRVLNEFLKNNNLDLVCRAHEVVEDGYEFFSCRQLVTIFSAPCYDDNENAGVVMLVGSDLACSFIAFKCTDSKPKKRVGNSSTMLEVKMPPPEE